MELRRIDHDEFMTVAKALYGDGAWEIVKSRAPEKKSGLSTGDKVLVASNVASAGLGVAALNTMRRQASGNIKRSAPESVRGGLPRDAARAGSKLRGSKVKALRPVGRASYGALKGMRRMGNTKVGAAVVGGGLLAGTAFNAAADVGSAASIAAKDKKKVAKRADSFTVTATVSKAMDDKRQVYGWASITEMNGQPVVDLQGDYVTIEEIEKAAHKYIASSRKGGDMHLRDGDNPVHVADLIESVVITQEKKEALGLPADSPTGWWVGMQVNDEETWRKVRSGERPMFSIHGSGRRQEVEIDA